MAQAAGPARRRDRLSPKSNGDGSALAGYVLLLAAAPVSAQQPAPLQLEGVASPQPWQRYRDWNKARWDDYNTMAARGVTPPKGSEIVLAEVKGDAALARSDAGLQPRAAAWSAIMGPKTQEGQMSVPTCRNRHGRTHRPVALQLRVRSAAYNPAQSMMPPWGKHGFYKDDDQDIVAASRDPENAGQILRSARRSSHAAGRIGEDRDAADPFVNPAMDRPPPVAPTVSSSTRTGLHRPLVADPKAAFRRWAVEMPKWEPRLGRCWAPRNSSPAIARRDTGADVLMKRATMSISRLTVANFATARRSRSIRRARCEGCLGARRGAVGRPRSASSTLPAPTAMSWAPTSGFAAVAGEARRW